MKSVSPRVRPRPRRVHRFALALGLLLTLAAGLPFITHGTLQTEDERATFARPAAEKRNGAEFVPGRAIVRFRSDAAAQAAEAAVTGLSIANERQIAARIERFEGSELIRGLRLAKVDPAATLAAIEALKERPDVLYAEPDYVRHIDLTPSEPEFANLWSLRNTGQQIIDNYRGSGGFCPTPPCTFSAGTAGADIKAEQAWNITTGSRNIVVGVIDEGMDISHPDLAANIWTNPGEVAANGLDDDGNGFIDDVHGWDFADNDNTVFDGPGTYPNDDTDAHGTHVAGTIGAVGNNGTGSVGINWQVSLLPLKFISGSGGASSDAIRAAAYAKALRDKYVATNGAQGANVRVLNNSYGGGGFLRSEQDAIAALANSDILFVAAAGNGGDDGVGDNTDITPEYPAGYVAPNIISVAATTRTDLLSSFSNFGSRSVHIAAPGSLVLSTTPNGTFDYYSGTSMATPHVVGVAALALAANPNLSVTQLRSLLLYNGDTIASVNTKTYSRRRLNAFKTVQAAVEGDATPPAAAGSLRITAQNGRSLTLAWTAPGDDGNAGQAALYELSFVDPGTGARTFLGTQLPQGAGASESATITLPFRHTTGQISVRTFDNVGNESTAGVAVVLDPVLADPYVPTEVAAAPLTAGGTPLNFHGDDSFQTVSLPFSFPFYGQAYTSATLSTNGIIYFGTAPTGNDAGSSTAELNSLTAIAGLWDDLRTDRTGGDVYVTQDSNHIIFRWQAVTFNTPLGGGTLRGENPVNFEIELRSDGTVQVRYGAGNTRVLPVVGLSGGAPDAYVIASHTSESTLVNLTNAATVTFSPRMAGGPGVHFSNASVAVSEGAGAVTLTVMRSATELASAASVTYATLDDAADVGCADTTNNHGAAYARCDYATAVDTVNFAAGQTSATLTIPVIDDGHFEGAETFQVALTGTSGGLSLNTPAVTTVTIQDNDTAATLNPLGGPTYPNPAAARTFFVRQHYLDFLSREPEAGEPWSGVLANCADEFNTDAAAPAAGCDRLTVSAAFFGSTEFQLKGYFVFRFYKVAFGSPANANYVPAYGEVIPDMRAVTGQTSAEVFQKKAAFAGAFAQRPAFTNIYGGMNNAQYVAALLGHYNLTQILTPDPAAPDGNVYITLTDNDLVTRLNAGTLTRGQVLRAVADSNEVLGAEFNRAFVAMQYYGYLRRTPEAAGYNAWLTYLDAHPQDFRTMVNGFMNSVEYRLRFGQP